jgi:hypothetical protein
MDMDTDNLFEHARARFAHAAARRVLQEKYQGKMTFAHAGGLWRAGPELLTTLMVCPDDTAVILDLHQNPVQVTVQELRVLAQQRWQEQMTAWQTEYQEISKRR